MRRPDRYSHSKQRVGPAVGSILWGRVTFVVKKLKLPRRRCKFGSAALGRV